MVGYLSLAVKMVLNVHDLNNEGSVGQSLDIRQIRMVDENGRELEEMPAVSGRMMKHWHLEHMRKRALEINSMLCSTCKNGQPDRQASAEDEHDAIKACVICDVHGFLSTAKIKNAPRRSSCVSFSWLLPVLDTKPETRQVIHSRVATGTEESSAGDETSQMIFHKTYASGVFGFVANIDFNRIGLTIDNRKIDSNINDRKKLAVQALLPICLGAFGASQSHALPHAKCLGLLAALSTTEKPVPNLISPIYPNGFQESVALLEAMDDSVQYWTYGQADSSMQDQAQTENNDSDKEKRKSVTTVQDVFKEILQAIDNEPKDK